MSSTPDNLCDAFEELVSAGTPGILIRTFEPDDALTELRKVCRDENNQWPLMTFDLDEGTIVDMLGPGGVYYQSPQHWTEKIVQGGKGYVLVESASKEPIQAIRGLPGLTANLSATGPDGAKLEGMPGILVMRNHQRWLNTPALVQTLANRLDAYKKLGLHVVLLSPTAELPLELQRLFESGHLTHELPSRAQIRAIIKNLAGSGDKPQSDEELEYAVDAAAGLTRLGVEAATALSLVRHGTVQPDVIFDLKAKAMAADMNSLELYRGSLTLDDYGGGGFLKEYCLDLLAERHEDPKLRPRGVFLLGPPGCGKTLLAKCLGSAVNRPTAAVTLGALRSKFQGQSFENLTRLLATLDAMSPLIAFFDEVEGQVSGGKDTGSMDAGTGSQINSKLLSWMSDRSENSDVFLLAACNDIRALMRDMPEFARMGRFDGLFFIDYPGRESKDAIWKIHLKGYRHFDKYLEDGATIDEAFSNFELPSDELWTGSEIEACCRLAAVRRRSLKEIGDHMPTISSQASDRIEEIREWAHGRCYAAEYEGIYRKESHAQRLAELSPASRPARRLRRPTRTKRNAN